MDEIKLLNKLNELADDIKMYKANVMMIEHLKLCFDNMEKDGQYFCNLPDQDINKAQSLAVISNTLDGLGYLITSAQASVNRVDFCDYLGD